MSRTGTMVALGAAVALLAGATVDAEAPPPPTPTPETQVLRSGSLGDYAARTVLTGETDHQGPGGGVVIDNDAVRRLATGGSLTTTGSAPLAGAAPRVTPTPGASRRGYWRRRVQAQRDTIAAVTNELSLADAKVRALEDAAFAGGRGAVKLWARVDEAKRKRGVVAGRLARERAALTTIIRAARREGAEPGWFR